MAVGSIAKKMLGFADEVAEGFSKGIGDAGTLKIVNKVASNMTPQQQAQAAKQLTRVSGLTRPTIANRIGDAVGGGAKDMYTSVKAGKGFGEAAQLAFTHNDKIRMDRVAGTFVGASAAARVATGGGLYKDRYGNGNLIGIPFI